MGALEVLLEPIFDSANEQTIVRYRKGKNDSQEVDFIIEETPVAVSYNDIAYTVMMCTPHDLEQFAVGFSLSEGIINHHREIHDIAIVPNCQGININITVANRCLARLQQKRRSLAGMTGCGICGEEKLETVRHPLTPLSSSVRFDLGQLDHILAQLLQLQQLNQLTGAAHAAAYIDSDGNIVTIYEDVGRHIALDKLVGHIHQQQLSGGVVLVTSRASFEMVQKAAAAGIEVLLAISSATQMAIDLARQLNVTLVGHCRLGRADAYSHPQRIIGAI